MAPPSPASWPSLTKPIAGTWCAAIARSSWSVSARLDAMSRGRTPAIGRSSKVIATSRAGGCASPRTTAAIAAMKTRTSRSLPARFARRRRPAGAVLAEVLHLVLLDVAIVFVERAGELVRAVVAADEVEVLGVGRVHRGLERGEAGRRNRPRRQPGIAIRVVGRIEREIPLVDVAAMAPAPAECEDPRRTTLQRHPDAQPRRVDGG